MNKHEGYEALRLGRRFVGAELKRSYWKQACANLTNAAASAHAPTLFDVLEQEGVAA
jgi:hypothetical protein